MKYIDEDYWLSTGFLLTSTDFYRLSTYWLLLTFYWHFSLGQIIHLYLQSKSIWGIFLVLYYQITSPQSPQSHEEVCCCWIKRQEMHHNILYSNWFWNIVKLNKLDFIQLSQSEEIIDKQCMKEQWADDGSRRKQRV